MKNENIFGLDERLASGQTGASAKAIVAHLVGYGEQDGAYPHDKGDFGRCERLLDAVPSLRANMHHMAEVNAYWAALVPRWDEIKRSTNQTALIKEITRPIEKADLGHIALGEKVSLRFGANTYRAEEPKMKETDEDRAVRDTTYRVHAAELRSFVERFERLEAEKKDIADQQKEVMAEAKARGYDTRVMRKVIALRKRDRDEIAEEEAVLEMYREVLGC